MKIKLLNTEIADPIHGLTEGMIVEAKMPTPEDIARDALGDETFETMGENEREALITMVLLHIPEGMATFDAPGSGENLIVLPENYEVVEE
nr:MAG TPA: hypothetical protein [Caudoviricetes sp.]